MLMLWKKKGQSTNSEHGHSSCLTCHPHLWKFCLLYSSPSTPSTVKASFLQLCRTAFMHVIKNSLDEGWLPEPKSCFSILPQIYFRIYHKTKNWDWKLRYKANPFKIWENQLKAMKIHDSSATKQAMLAGMDSQSFQLLSGSCDSLSSAEFP